MDRHPPAGTDLSTAFAFVLLASAALRLALAIHFGELPPRYDETEYAAYGRAIAEEGGRPVSWRAPGYQWFVALGWAAGGGRPVGVRVLQVLVSIAATVLVYRIGRVRWGERAGLAAGAFMAFYPSDVSFSHLFWSETLFGALALGAFDRALAASANARVRTAALAGLLLGAATLTRSVGAVWAAATAAWLLARAPRGASHAAALAAGWAILVLPWSIDASVRAGRFVLVDTNSGFNLWSGNNDRIPRDLASLWCVGLPAENGASVAGPFGALLPEGSWREDVAAQRAREGILDPEGPDADAWYRREAIAAIERDPSKAIARAVPKAAAFWAPDFFLPRHLVRDWYGSTPAWLAIALVALTGGAAAVPLLAGPAALGASRASPFRSLAITWIVTSLAVHVVAYGHSRMHAPLVPLLTLAVAGALAERTLLGRWLARGAPWGALALAAWVLAAPAVAGVYLMPGPRHESFARALGTLRHAPLPGARWVAWMRAGVDEAGGDLEGADSILREGPWSEDPWTLFLRGRIALARGTTDPSRAPSPESWALAVSYFDRAAALDPDSRALEAVSRFAREEVGRAAGSSP